LDKRRQLRGRTPNEFAPAYDTTHWLIGSLHGVQFLLGTKKGVWKIKLHAIAPLAETQNGLEPPHGREPISSGSALLTAFITFLSILFVYLLLRPPLYNFDGYSVRMQALQPFDSGYINPHHLFWYFFQRVVAAVASAIGSPSPEAFQFSGILITSVSIALLCLLMVRQTQRILLPFAISVFIAFSPSIWALGLQDQPYTLLALCIVLALWTFAGWGTPSPTRLIASGLVLGLAILLQQAVAITIPAIGLGWLIAGEGNWRERLKRVATCVASIAIVVGGVYLFVAHSAGVEPGGFLKWTTEYLQDQHGIQLHWPETAIKSVMGITGSLVESSWVSYQLNPWAHRAAIGDLYGAILALGVAAAALLLLRRTVRERLARLFHSDAAFAMALLQVLAWGAFGVLWEPSGHFWSVNLFPLAFLATWWFRCIGKRTAAVVAGLLLIVSAWNVYANHRQDQAFSISYPPPLLEQLRAELGPNDVFIVAGRDWYANRDYSLLLECLDEWPRNPAMALLDDYVMKGPQQEWEGRLQQDIAKAFAAGGRVYVAEHVFWPDSYRDLEQTGDPFSAYAHMEYAGLGTESLAGQIASFFNRYQLRPSNFRVGTDTFLQITPKP
jgi:hypothetical protein